MIPFLQGNQSVKWGFCLQVSLIQNNGKHLVTQAMHWCQVGGSSFMHTSMVRWEKASIKGPFPRELSHLWKSQMLERYKRQPECSETTPAQTPAVLLLNSLEQEKASEAKALMKAWKNCKGYHRSKPETKWSTRVTVASPPSLRAIKLEIRIRPVFLMVRNHREQDQ